MAPVVETSTPPRTPTPIGPYSHVAKVGPFITIGGTAGVESMSDFDEMNRTYMEAMGDLRPAQTVVAVKELPKPGVLLTMNLTAVTRD